MSTKNKKSIASQALLDMDAITNAIKEESKKSISLLLTEAVKDALREGCEKEEEEKDYDVIDDETTDAKEKEDSVDEPSSDDESTPIEGDKQSEDGDAETLGAETEPEMGEPAEENGTAEKAPETGDGSEDEWDDFSEYRSGDDYDLTGEKDLDKIMKVYKLLGNDDAVVVNRDGDKINLKDNTNGADYIIDLGTDAKADDGEDLGGSDSAPEINESDIAGIDDDSLADEETPSIEDLMQKINAMQNEIDSLRRGETTEPAINEDKKKRTKKSMKEAKDMLFEIDLGYTDSYQDKDPVAGLSNSEPSKNKSLDKGIPTDTKKPWAGDSKSKGQPFEKTIEETEEPVLDGDAGDIEVDEQKNVGGFVQQNSVTASNIPNSNGRKARNAHKGGVQVTGTADNRSTMAEALKNLTAENKKLKAVNKELKEAILAIKKNLNEAYVTNANLGKITKLFLENSTTQAEKVDIVNRFTNEAKTIEQSKNLYESIKRELSKPRTNTPVMTESKTANGTKALNEEKPYKSPELLKTIDFMNRVLNC